MPNPRPATAPSSSPSRSRPWCATAGPRIGAAAPSGGAISSPNCSPRRPSMPPGPTVYPTTCATAPPPKRFRPSSISISTTSPQSSRPVVLAVTDQDKVGNFQAALLGKIQPALTVLILDEALATCDRAHLKQNCIARAAKFYSCGTPPAPPRRRKPSGPPSPSRSSKQPAA